jgi:hypothetical protein
MKKSLLLATLLLAGTAAGSALALTRDGADALRHTIGLETARGEASDAARVRVAGDHRRDRDHDRHGRDHHRDHHDDDEDDDDDGARGARMPATGPTDPSTPVPDNGLFQGKTRPKVEVN